MPLRDESPSCFQVRLSLHPICKALRCCVTAEICINPQLYSTDVQFSLFVLYLSSFFPCAAAFLPAHEAKQVVCEVTGSHT